MELITLRVEEQTLYLQPHGRIDTTNADEAERLIGGICDGNPGCKVALDAEDLEYVSSAGLRVILRIRKKHPDFVIINASSEVYEILDMTGFTEMMPVSKAYKKLCVDGCEIIGQGAKGTVYRYNADTVVKVYRNADALPAIHKERELARRAFVLGIPTAISYDVVKVGESYGSVFELLDAKSYTKLIRQDPENMDVYVREFAELLRQIHETPVKKEDMPPVKDLIRKWVETVKPELEAGAAEKLEQALQDASDELMMIHGDYHTNNVMKQNGETLLIDMDTLSYGDPVFELANVYISYVGFTAINDEMVEKFIGLPAATCRQIWEKFLPMYLDTTDEAVLKEKEDKIRLWSNVRLMRHMLRRGGKEDPESLRVILGCKEEIEQALA